MELFDESHKIVSNKNHSKFAQKINTKFETIDKVYIKPKMSMLNLPSSPKLAHQQGSPLKADHQNIKIHTGASEYSQRASFVTNRTNESRDTLKDKKTDHLSDRKAQVYSNKFITAIKDKKRVQNLESAIKELSSVPSEGTQKEKKSLYSQVKILENRRDSESKLNPISNSLVHRKQTIAVFPKLGQRTLSHFNVINNSNSEKSMSIQKKPHM